MKAGAHEQRIVPTWAWVMLGVVVVTCGAIAYAAANLGSYLTANREVIAERVSRTLGRPVRFERLALSLGRGLGIAVGELAIGEDPRFGTGDCLTAQDAFVQIRVLPALFGRFEVTRVSLDKPTISLVRTADGFNFETMSSGEVENEQVSPAESHAIAIALLDIADGTVRYVDRTTKRQHDLTATRLDFHASDLSFGDALRFELSTAVLGAEAANVNASGAVGPVDPEDPSATPLDIIVQFDGVDGSALQAATTTPSELRVDGSVAGKLEVGGTLAAWSLNFVVNPSAAHIAYGRMVDKARDVPLSITGRVEKHADDTIVADPIEIATSSSVLTVRGTVTPSASTSSSTIAVSGTGVSLADWGSVLPALREAGLQGLADVALGIRNPAAATSPVIDGRIALDGVGGHFGEATMAISQLSGVISFKGRAASFGPSDLRIGGAPARIRASVDDVLAPVVAFELSSDSLPLAAVIATDSNDTVEGLDANGRISLSGRAPALDAELRADAATIGGVPMKNLHAKLVHAEGRTRIAPVTLDSCGGQLRGFAERFAPEGSSVTPRFDIEIHAGEMSIPALAAALSGGRRGAPAAGTVTFELSAGGAGSDWPSIREALRGSGRFDIVDGAILGINIPEATLEGVTGVAGLSALLPARLRSDFPALFGREDTRFDALAASFRIEKGRLQTQDLAVTARDFAIDAAGTLGLDLGVDLDATLTTSSELSSRLVEQVAALSHLTNRSGKVMIPFRLAGTIPSVIPRPDTAALAASLQRSLVESLGEKLLGAGKKKKPAPAATP